MPSAALSLTPSVHVRPAHCPVPVNVIVGARVELPSVTTTATRTAPAGGVKLAVVTAVVPLPTPAGVDASMLTALAVVLTSIADTPDAPAASDEPTVSAPGVTVADV